MKPNSILVDVFITLTQILKSVGKKNNQTSTKKIYDCCNSVHAFDSVQAKTCTLQGGSKNDLAKRYNYDSRGVRTHALRTGLEYLNRRNYDKNECLESNALDHSARESPCCGKISKLPLFYTESHDKTDALSRTPCY